MVKFSIRKKYGWDKFKFRQLEPRGGFYRETIIPLPFINRSFTITSHVRTYAQAVGFDLPIDWILDEFDDSFNDLAIASMKYHMYYSVVETPPALKANMERIIADLSYPEEKTDLSLKMGEHLKSIDGDLSFMMKHMKECSVCQEYKKQIKEEDEAYNKRMLKARHDFVDIMVELWS